MKSSTQEIEELTKQVAKLQEAVSVLEQKLQKPEEWPTEGDDYWFIDERGVILNAVWNADMEEEYRKDFGNCFHTEKDATEARDKVMKLLQSLHTN